MSKQFAMQAKVHADSAPQAVHLITKQITERGMEGVFSINEIPPSISTINIMLLEHEAPMMNVAFRGNIEGLAQAEACFELLALKMGFVEGLDEAQSAIAIEEGKESGMLVNGGKVLYYIESTPIEEVEELSELLDVMEDVEDDYSRMDD
jgi:hypothetical protein